jgi:hypothetical protein
LLAASDRDWLAVRPVTLTDGAPRKPARAVTRYGLMSTIRRSEVATWMLDAVAQPARFAVRHVLLGTCVTRAAAERHVAADETAPP